MSSGRFQRTFLILLVVAVSVAFVAMIRDFLITLLLAAIFSGLSRPLHGRLLSGFRGHRSLAAAVTLLVVVIVVVGPLLAFLGIVAGEAFRISQSVGPWIQEQIADPSHLQGYLKSIPGIERLEPYRAQILTRVGQTVGAVGNFLFQGLQATTRGTLKFLFHFGILLYAMFFFLKDGDRLLQRILYYLPLEPEDEAQMIERFVSVARATLKGTFIIGVLQGGLAGLALALAGINGAVFWGTVMTVLSIIPGVGTALVWGPAAVYLVIAGKLWSGLILALFCAGIVGSIDNVLRPRLVGKDAKLHDLLILVSTLGGLVMFGIVGFIIGPILGALFVAIWDIYGFVFKDSLPGATPAGHGDLPTE